MSWLIFNGQVARPSAPAANKQLLYYWAPDESIHALDDDGVDATLTPNGWRDKNIMLNAGFLLWQRQTPETLTPYAANAGARTFGADRWGMTIESSSVEARRVDTGGAPETGLTAEYYARFKQITAVGKLVLSQVAIGRQSIPLRAKSVRVQCVLRRAVAAAMTIRIGLIALGSTGTIDVIPNPWITAVNGNGVDPTLGANLMYVVPRLPEGGVVLGNAISCSLTTTWGRYGGVFDVPAGTKNLIMAVWTNDQLSINDEILLSEAGLFEGEERRLWVPWPYSLDVNTSQAYYLKTFPIDIGPVQNAGLPGSIRCPVTTAGAVTNSICGQWRFPTRMRATPSPVTFYNPLAAHAFVQNTSRISAATATSAANACDTSLDYNATGAAPWAIGDSISVQITAEAEI